MLYMLEPSATELESPRALPGKRKVFQCQTQTSKNFCTACFGMPGEQLAWQARVDQQTLRTIAHAMYARIASVARVLT